MEVIGVLNGEDGNVTLSSEASPVFHLKLSGHQSMIAKGLLNTGRHVKIIGVQTGDKIEVDSLAILN